MRVNALLALRLQVSQSGGVFFALSAQAAFLNAEIAELPLIEDEHLRIDQGGADSRIFVFELGGKLEPAKGVDAHFECGNAEEAPFGVGKRLYEILFAVVFGLVLLEEARDVGLVSGGIVTGQQNSAAGEPGFYGIE